MNKRQGEENNEEPVTDNGSYIIEPSFRFLCKDPLAFAFGIHRGYPVSERYFRVIGYMCFNVTHNSYFTEQQVGSSQKQMNGLTFSRQYQQQGQQFLRLLSCQQGLHLPCTVHPEALSDWPDWCHEAYV